MECILYGHHFTRVHHLLHGILQIGFQTILKGWIRNITYRWKEEQGSMTLYNALSLMIVYLYTKVFLALRLKKY